MKKVIFMAALIVAALGGTTKVSAQTMRVFKTNDDYFHKPHRISQTNRTPKVFYNSASTLLSVSFPTNAQGGRVEIYRNGTKVVNAAAPAGASLSYVLRKYGIGSYAIIVSSGKTVVYNNCVEVK